MIFQVALKFGHRLLQPFATICDSLPPFVTVCDHLRTFMNACDHLRPFATIYDHLRPFATNCDFVLLYFDFLSFSSPPLPSLSPFSLLSVSLSVTTSVILIVKCSILNISNNTIHIKHQVLVQCWAAVCDSGSSFKHFGINLLNVLSINGALMVVPPFTWDHYEL